MSNNVNLTITMHLFCIFYWNIFNYRIVLNNIIVNDIFKWMVQMENIHEYAFNLILIQMKFFGKKNKKKKNKRKK